MSRNFVLGWVVACLTIYITVGPFMVFDWSILIPKTSGDVSSWVQAVGSILAVGAAAYLPFWHESAKEKKKINELRDLIELETQAIIGQLNRIIFNTSFDETRTLYPIDFYFKDRMSELAALGNETYFIGTDLRAKINHINIKIEDIRERSTEAFKKELIKDAKETQRYVQKKQDRLAALRTLHHTAPPSA